MNDLKLSHGNLGRLTAASTGAAAFHQHGIHNIAVKIVGTTYTVNVEVSANGTDFLVFGQITQASVVRAFNLGPGWKAVRMVVTVDTTLTSVDASYNFFL